jgi:hypothetical protein
MIAAGLDVFARTLHKTYEWLGEIEDVKHILPAELRELWT